MIRRLRHGDFTGGEPVEQFVLLLQEATRADATVPQRTPRGAPSPRRIAPPQGRPDGDVQRFAADGFTVLYAPSMRNGEREGLAEDRGNAIVSTVPLQRPRFIELPLQRQRRVAVMAAVAGATRDGGRWRLDLVNVHLDPMFPLWHGATAARRRQAAALIDALRAVPRSSDERSVMVLAGDLNSWRGPRDATVRLLSEAFPGSVALDDSQPTWTGPLGLHAAFDRIFVLGGASPVRATRLPSRFGSDHYPLLIVLHF